MNNELYHYGVRGMKWGVRKDRSKRYYDKADYYRGKAYGTGSYADGTYKQPKNSSSKSFEKNLKKATKYDRKGNLAEKREHDRKQQHYVNLHNKAAKSKADNEWAVELAQHNVDRFSKGKSFVSRALVKTNSMQLNALKTQNAKYDRVIDDCLKNLDAGSVYVSFVDPITGGWSNTPRLVRYSNR